MGLLHKKNKSGSGRKSKLNNKQLKELSKILSSEERLTIHDVMKIIKDKWDINYTYAGAKTLLIESWRKLIITSISKIYYPILLYQTIISPSFFKHTK